MPDLLSKAPSFAGAIIAGGHSTRMGGPDKLLEKIGGHALIDRIIARVKPQVAALIINANTSPERFSHTGLSVIPDELTDIGTPLAGLHAALVWAKAENHDWLLTVTGDAPFLPDDLALRLAHTNRAAAIAASGRQAHYLTGLWRTDLLAQFKPVRFLRVQDWARMVGAVQVEWPILPYDPFLNINTQQDLAEARRIAAEFHL